jgi:hypothetical protein
VGIAGIGLGLSRIGVAGALHGEAGDVEDPLLSLPQQSQQKSRTAAGLVDGPDDLIGEGESFVDELGEVGLVVFDLSGEQFFSRSVEHVSPMDLFPSIDPDPDSVHAHLHRSFGSSPAENPADGSLCSESLTSPISISAQGLQRDRGAIPFKPSDGGEQVAILGPCGRHPDTVPGQHTK